MRVTYMISLNHDVPAQSITKLHAYKFAAYPRNPAQTRTFPRNATRKFGLAQPTPLAADCFLAYWSRPSCPKDARQRSRRSRHSQDQVRSWQGWWRDRQAEIVAREPRLSLKRPRSPRLRNPDRMWTAPWQAPCDMTALWRLHPITKPSGNDPSLRIPSLPGPTQQGSNGSTPAVWRPIRPGQVSDSDRRRAVVATCRASGKG